MKPNDNNSLPNINMVKGATTFKTWINQTWLNNLDLEMPQTTEELYEVLKAFKEQDANGNGDPNDELPLAGQGKTSDGSVDLFKWFYGYWGFQKIKIQDARFDVVDGQVRYMPTDDRYRSMVEYVGRLWSEGLIDQDYFTTDRNQLLSKMDQGIVGYSPAGNNNNMCGTAHRDEYVQADVLTGPYGDQISSYVNPMTLRGGVAISTSCEYPEALIRWIDYFYGEEGTALMRMGIEGETYIVNEDGEYEYTEYVTNNPDGLTQEMAIGTFTIWGGGGVPQVMTLKTDKSANTTEFNLAATEKIEPYIPDEVVSLNFTLEELDQLAMMEADIDLCGAKTPLANQIDGVDLSEVLLEGKSSPRKEFFYYIRENLEAVRAGNWKLHVAKDGKPVRLLYDLEHDVSESRNLYEEYPEIAAELSRKIEECRKDLGDAVTQTAGENVRPIGRVENPHPLTEYREDHPYIVMMYDREEIG